MFRWSFLVPRMLVILLVCVGILFGLDPLLRQVIVRGSQALVGGKVDLNAVQSAPMQGRLSLLDVAVTDPTKPMENLFEFDRGWFGLDTRSLLRRRFVVARGEISGLRFGTARHESGALVSHDPKKKDRKSRSLTDHFLTRRLHQGVEDWLDDLASRLQADVADEFPSIRLATELSRRWPDEYADLAARVDQLKARADEIQQLAGKVRREPLRHLETARRGLSEAEAIRLELLELRSELNRLYQQALIDQDDVREAAEADLAKIREALQLRKIDTQELTDYLLGEDLAARMANLSQWLETGRRVADCVANRPEINHERGRGIDVDFASTSSAPDLLLRLLRISGSGNWDNTPFEFAGTVEDLTPQPRRHQQPTRVRLATRGPCELHIDATVDHRQAPPHYDLGLSAPAVQQPGQVLGNADQLALELSPGSAVVWAQIALVGDTVTGELRWRQDDIRLTPRVANRLGGHRLQESLATALSEVDQMHALVTIAGSVSHPDFAVRSNLGSQLADAVNRAAQRELQAAAERATTQLQASVDQQMEHLQRSLQTHRKELLARLSSGEQLLAEFTQQISRQLHLPQGLLPNDLLETGLRVGSLLGQ